MNIVAGKRKRSLGEYIYIIALALGIAGSLLLGTMSPWASHAMYLVRAGIILCIIKTIFIDRFTASELGTYAVCLGLAVLSYDSVRHGMLLVIPFIFGAKDVDFKKIMKTYLVTVVLLLLMINALALFRKIPNLVFFRDGKPRNSYGFTYPTLEAAHIFYLLLAYAVYKKFKFNLFQDFMVAVLGYFIISRCDARLDAYLTFALLFVIICRKLLFKVMSKLNDYVPAIVVIILVVGYLLLAKNYNPMSSTYFHLNTLLSNRLSLTQQGLMRYPVKLFGNHVQMQGFGGYAGQAMAQTSWMARNYFYIDNSFAQILLINGSVLFIITLAVCTYVAWKNMKIKNYSFVLAIMFLIISGSIEAFLIQLSYNIFIVVILANTQYWERKKDEEISCDINNK